MAASLAENDPCGALFGVARQPQPPRAQSAISGMTFISPDQEESLVYLRRARILADPPHLDIHDLNCPPLLQSRR